MKPNRVVIILGGIVLALIGGFTALGIYVFRTPAFALNINPFSITEKDERPFSATPFPEGAIFEGTHLPTPVPLKALYMSAWVAGTPTLRERLIKLIETSELNAVVIDIKDYTGRISYAVADPALAATHASDMRIRDVRELIAELHQKHIYVIGRIAVFQDPYYVSVHPDYGVHRKSAPTELWADHKGIHWLDAGERPVWDYAVAIGRDAYKAGFDELNFDYVRYPSDGNMEDLLLPATGDGNKAETIKQFFSYLHDQLSGTGPIISADLFGMTTVTTDDMGIGQVLENALPYFDYIDPMVYPSHFPPNWNGYKSPAKNPYAVIKYTMDRSVERARVIGVPSSKIRPWLQDFDLGAIYTPELVREQMTATYDAGLTSWILWDASNRYTPAALLPKTDGGPRPLSDAHSR